VFDLSCFERHRQTFPCKCRRKIYFNINLCHVLADNFSSHNSIKEYYFLDIEEPFIQGLRWLFDIVVKVRNSRNSHARDTTLDGCVAKCSGIGQVPCWCHPLAGMA
jgi:hypothetical protein